ncbi:hypothetical protein [uncultured Shewanella sp.]|uniref:hypothetical protein n=1 Tax=uncultured Shewanella sp. TaxID=173975 RepID=UPI0026095747|nr:hypothetical protein [uncultured Shewanella sp.]
MFRKILALYLFAVTSPAMANEEPLTVVCENCIYSTSMETTAKAQAVLDETVIVYVINIEEEKVEKFDVTKVLSGSTSINNDTKGESNKTISHYTTTAVNIGVDSEYQENFDDMMADRREIQAAIDAWQYDDDGSVEDDNDDIKPIVSSVE